MTAPGDYGSAVGHLPRRRPGPGPTSSDARMVSVWDGRQPRDGPKRPKRRRVLGHSGAWLPGWLSVDNGRQPTVPVRPRTSCSTQRLSPCRGLSRPTWCPGRRSGRISAAGLEEIVTFSVTVSGPGGSVAVSGAHGTATGVAGTLLLRPLARLVSKRGDVVTTYREPQSMKLTIPGRH